MAMRKLKPKKSFIRRQIWAMVVSAAITSGGAYYWRELVQLGSFVIDKALNRSTATKVQERSRVPAILTNFQKQE
jgi:hypothetical protein